MRHTQIGISVQPCASGIFMIRKYHILLCMVLHSESEQLLT